MSIETISYAGWKHCLRLSDGRIEALITTDVGPRVLRFGAVHGANLLHEHAEQRGLAGGTEWRAYGGHRLWHAPEVKPRTYAPDNDPVPYQLGPDRVRLDPGPEPGTGIQKSLEISLVPGHAGLELVHRLTNRNPWAVDLAPWAVTIMAPGGIAIVPQEPFAPHPDFQAGAPDGLEPSYLPVRSMALWPFTRLNDPRWIFLDRFILTRQDPAIAAPLKYGVSNRQGWSAYVRAGEMLLKRFPAHGGGCYPDRGCNTEVWINGEMLELESLGPMARLEPGGSVAYRETWFYFQDVALPLDGAALETVLQPLLASCAAE